MKPQTIVIQTNKYIKNANSRSNENKTNRFFVQNDIFLRLLQFTNIDRIIVLYTSYRLVQSNNI